MWESSRATRHTESPRGWREPNAYTTPRARLPLAAGALWRKRSTSSSRAKSALACVVKRASPPASSDSAHARGSAGSSGGSGREGISRSKASPSFARFRYSPSSLLLLPVKRCPRIVSVHGPSPALLGLTPGPPSPGKAAPNALGCSRGMVLTWYAGPYFRRGRDHLPMNGSSSEPSWAVLVRG